MTEQVLGMLGKLFKRSICSIIWVILEQTKYHKLIHAMRQTICALRPTFEKLFTGAKVRRKAQKIDVGRKIVYEIDPGFVSLSGWSWCHHEPET